jgi:hypothetical protein
MKSMLLRNRKNVEGQIDCHNVPGFLSFYEICAMNAKFTIILHAFFFVLNEISRIGSTPATPTNYRNTIG